MLLETTARNAAADAVVDLVDGGAGAGTVTLKDNGGTPFAVITLQDPAFGGAAVGVATLAGTPSDSSADASADLTSLAGTAEFRDSDSNLIFTCSVGGPTLSGSTEMDIDRDTITAGDTVTITSFTYTQPAGSV